MNVEMQADLSNAIISIQNLELSTVIGCYRREKDCKQPVIVDLELVTDCTVVAESDAIDDALDYVVIVEALQALALDHGCELLESFGQKIAKTLSQFESIKSYVLTVKKPHAITACDYVSFTLKSK